MQQTPMKRQTKMKVHTKVLYIMYLGFLFKHSELLIYIAFIKILCITIHVANFHNAHTGSFHNAHTANFHSAPNDQ